MSDMTITTPEPRAKRWTREEFYELAEQGYFRNKRVQLIEGEIIEMAPQGHPHSWTITLLNRWATTNFPSPALVRVQMPLNATGYSDPEPDLAIVPEPKMAESDHPETAELVIEVSDSSVKLDRRKAGIYAAAGVQEYWLVNLAESQVEVHRGNERCYEHVTVHRAGETISPLVRPQAQLVIAEILKA